MNGRVCKFALSRCFLRTNQGEQEEKYKEKVLKWKEKAEEFNH